MSDITINRIVSQIKNTVKMEQDNKKAPINDIVFVSLDDLRNILKKELVIEHVSEEKKVNIHFQSIYDFVEWYEKNKEEFSIQQKTALDTLSVARRAIEAGCVCKRAQREIRAFQYFEQFWLNNKNSDLLPTILKITKVNKISINNYCSCTL